MALSACVSMCCLKGFAVTLLQVQAEQQGLGEMHVRVDLEHMRAHQIVYLQQACLCCITKSSV